MKGLTEGTHGGEYLRRDGHIEGVTRRMSSRGIYTEKVIYVVRARAWGRRKNFVHPLAHT